MIPELDRGGLRNFGITIGTIFVGLFGLIIPLTFGLRYPIWPWILGLILVIWALVAPASLRIIYRGWMQIGLLLNGIVSPVVLGIIFFLIVTPFGLVMRLFGQDPMARKRAVEKTCRVHSAERESNHMERPY